VMISIWKYPVGQNGIVEVPIGAKIRKVAMQDGTLTLWCEVSTDTFMREVLQITAYGTGNMINYPREQKYLDTIFLPDGLVWHIYVDKERRSPLPPKQLMSMEELRNAHT
jgi:hypothetical protein